MLRSRSCPDQPLAIASIVEPLPRQNGWDWTVWRSGALRPGESRYGRASSGVSAMAAAEDAARHWWKTGSPSALRPSAASGAYDLVNEFNDPPGRIRARIDSQRLDTSGTISTRRILKACEQSSVQMATIGVLARCNLCT